MIANRQMRLRECLINRVIRSRGCTLATAFLEAARMRPDLFTDSCVAPRHLLFGPSVPVKPAEPALLINRRETTPDQLGIEDADLLGDALLKEAMPRLRAHSSHAQETPILQNRGLALQWEHQVRALAAEHSLEPADAWNLAKGRDLPAFVAYVNAASGGL